MPVFGIWLEIIKIPWGLIVEGHCISSFCGKCYMRQTDKPIIIKAHFADVKHCWLQKSTVLILATRQEPPRGASWQRHFEKTWTFKKIVSNTLTDPGTTRTWRTVTGRKVKKWTILSRPVLTVISINIEVWPKKSPCSYQFYVNRVTVIFCVCVYRGEKSNWNQRS